MNLLTFTNELDGIGFDLKVENQVQRYYGFENVDNELEYSLNQFNPNADLIFLFGIGIGYELEEIVKRKKKNTSIIIFDYEEILLFALKVNNNLRTLLEDEYVNYISLNNEFDDKIARQIVSHHYWRFTKNVNSIELRYFTKVAAQSSRDIQQYIFSAWKFMFFQSGNDLEDSLMGIKNSLNNIKYYKTSISIRDLNHFNGIPAVCVASGPSFSKQLPLLKKIKDKVIVIAADSIYEALRKEGIVADIITVQERGEVIYNLFFKNKKIEKDTILLAQSVVDQKIFEDCPNHIVSFKELEYETYINDALQLNNVLFNGGSCANLSPAIAEKLGCNPIILIGQDLAFSNSGESHDSNSTSIRTNLNENTEEDFRKPQKTISWDKKNTVLTTEIWKSFKINFEEFATLYSNDFLNCTEGGSFINNWNHISFEDAINQFSIMEMSPLKKRPIDIIQNFSLTKEVEEYRISQLKKSLEVLSEENNKVLIWLKKRFKKLNYLVSKYEDKETVSRKDNEYVQTILATHDDFLFSNILSTLLYGPLRYTYHRKILENIQIENGQQFSKLCNILGGFLFATYEAYENANSHIRDIQNKLKSSNSEA